MFRRLILISGPVSVGKTTLADSLKRFGARSIKTRMLITAATGVSGDRAALQAAGEQLDVAGPEWLADALVREAEGIEDNAEIVIDSVRISGQIDAIRSRVGTRV